MLNCLICFFSLLAIFIGILPVQAERADAHSKGIEGVWQGKLNDAGNELSGTWKQGAASLPLTLKRTDKAPDIRRPQEPKKPYPYDEQEVTLDSTGAKLAGTLTTPRESGPYTAVVLIAGSGPHTRHESVTA